MTYALQTQKTPDDRATEFKPTQGGNDSTSAGSLLVAAYLVMWALLMAFIFLNHRRQQGIEKRIADLESSISGKSGKIAKK